MFDAKLFNGKHTIAVALSGGKDSVFLLHSLLAHRHKLNIDVRAINVEHGIRGESSLKDTAFTVDLCKSWGVKIKCYSVNAPEHAKMSGLSLENSARVLRYNCFKDAIKNGFCDCVATAHHLSDNAETLLFNLFRGSSPSGLTGISEISEDGTIIRPILNLTREEIDQCVKQNNLPFVTDETNDCDDFTRNYLRNQIIPLIKQRFPTFERSIERFAEICKSESDFLNEQAKTLIKGNSVLFADKTSDVLFLRACKIVIKSLGFDKDYEKVHLDALLSLAKGQTGNKINLKNQLLAIKTKDGVLFERNKEQPTNLVIPFTLGSISFDNYTLNFEKSGAITHLNALSFDLDKLPDGAVIRLKQPGDKICAFGGKNKTLKKYFSDKKIESRVSSTLPLIAKGNQIYLVCGVDISENLRVDENSRNIIKFTFTNKEI